MGPAHALSGARRRSSVYPKSEIMREARRAAGYQLERVQAGALPADWKPMPAVGLGVQELRIRAGGAFRVIFVARFVEAVYVLHAFQKKSQKTARADIGLARMRFAALMVERKGL